MVKVCSLLVRYVNIGPMFEQYRDSLCVTLPARNCGEDRGVLEVKVKEGKRDSQWSAVSP